MIKTVVKYELEVLYDNDMLVVASIQASINEKGGLRNKQIFKNNAPLLRGGLDSTAKKTFNDGNDAHNWVMETLQELQRQLRAWRMDMDNIHVPSDLVVTFTEEANAIVELSNVVSEPVIVHFGDDWRRACKNTENTDKY
jgi:hypothetical protein